MLGGLGSALGPLAAGIVDRRQRSGDDGVRVAVVGADRLVHAADRAAAAASGTILKLDRTLVAIVAAGVALAAIPFLRLPAFYESFLYLVFHWIVLATSWNILSGYSGYFSFGHGAFYGAGVYTTAVLAGTFDVPFLWTLPVAALVAALLGVALGAVVFRVRQRARRAVRAADARGHVRARNDRPQHADRRRTRRLPVRACRCRRSRRRRRARST